MSTCTISGAYLISQTTQIQGFINSKAQAAGISNASVFIINDMDRKVHVGVVA